MLAKNKSEEWEKALQLFARMRQSDVQLDATSYNSAISACEKREGGKRLCNSSLKFNNLEFNWIAILYNSAMSACEKGEEWEKALQLFARMRQSEVQLDVTPHNSAISASEKVEEWEKALQLFAQMHSIRSAAGRDFVKFCH